MFGTFCLATSVSCGSYGDLFPRFFCLFREIEFRLR